MKIKCIIIAICLASSCFAQDGVIVLHGLARSSKAMSKMEKALKANGFAVVNVDYPSTTTNIATLTEKHIPLALSSNIFDKCQKINFVTHSMGGIMVRYYFKNFSTQKLGRVVMLGPPNQGSELVDKLKKTWAFKSLNGPAGQELSTATNSMPNIIGQANFDLGVIAGDRTINYINSSLYLPGPDDGKVTVPRTKIKGMNDWILMHATHPMMSKNKKVIAQTIYFLKNGKFDKQ